MERKKKLDSPSHSIVAFVFFANESSKKESKKMGGRKRVTMWKGSIGDPGALEYSPLVLVSLKLVLDLTFRRR